MNDSNQPNPSGQARMVDITEKPATQREAVARGTVKMQPSTLDLLKQGEIKKGDVFGVARIAGILAAKQTPNLIPLCHPLHISNAIVDFQLDEENNDVEITATIKGVDKTGMEMEALTAVAISALTIYDMCKPHDPGMFIERIYLVRKSGGKSGTVSFNSP